MTHSIDQVPQINTNAIELHNSNDVHEPHRFARIRNAITKATASLMIGAGVLAPAACGSNSSEVAAYQAPGATAVNPTEAQTLSSPEQQQASAVNYATPIFEAKQEKMRAAFISDMKSQPGYKGSLLNSHIEDFEERSIPKTASESNTNQEIWDQITVHAYHASWEAYHGSMDEALKLAPAVMGGGELGDLQATFANGRGTTCEVGMVMPEKYLKSDDQRSITINNQGAIEGVEANGSQVRTFTVNNWQGDNVVMVVRLAKGLDNDGDGKPDTQQWRLEKTFTTASTPLAVTGPNG